MYFISEKDDELNAYTIRMTERFYDYAYDYYVNDSYWNIVYRLFNLSPYDFYHYASYAYGARYKKSRSIHWFKMFFLDKKSAENFCKELNRRMSFCVEHKYF